MQPAPLPTNETRRLAVLRELGLLDTEPEGGFDALVRAAAGLTGCAIALITLVDEARQWFKAAHGLALRETPRDISMCAHAILDDALLEVPDALDDARFTHHPWVTGAPGVRFYAGVPLRFRGARLGTLCVLDTAPRRLDADARETLFGLAGAVTELMHSRQRMTALHDE